MTYTIKRWLRRRAADLVWLACDLRLIRASTACRLSDSLRRRLK